MSDPHLPRDDRPLEKAVLEQWPEHRPAPAFADRVMAALPPQPPARASRWPVVAAFAAGALVVLLALWLWPRDTGRPDRRANAKARAPATGELDATTQTVAAMGPQLVAVAEADAQLSWRTEGRAVAVRHRAGRAFYNAGGPATVDVPSAVLKLSEASFAIDAGAGHTDLVVYSGQVAVVHASTRTVVGAGRRRRITRRGIGPDRPAPWLAPPLPHPPRPTIAARAPMAAAPCADDEPVFDPPPATLTDWARECRLRFDVAPLGYDPGMLDHFLDELGATSTERARIADAVAPIDAAADADIERLFVDITGDDALAARSSVQWMFEAVLASADADEPAEVRRKISRERAGLRIPPVDFSRLTPYEELVRILMRSGDELQHALDRTLGRRRSLQLRRRNGGWPGLRWDVAGCPPRPAEPNAQ